jgi:thioesterase domain-containing protein
MARQLETQGESIGLLALFDTYGPGYPRVQRRSISVFKTAVYWLERARNVREILGHLEPRDRMSYVLAKARKAKRILWRKYAWKKNEIAIAFQSKTGRPLPKDMQRNHKAIQTALRSYKPEVLGGRLTLFRASRQPIGVVPDEALGWHGLALGGLEIHETPGFHGAVTVDPYARYLAQKLTPCLLGEQRAGESPFVQTAPASSRAQAQTTC